MEGSQSGRCKYGIVGIKSYLFTYSVLRVGYMLSTFIELVQFFAVTRVFPARLLFETRSGSRAENHICKQNKTVEKSSASDFIRRIQFFILHLCHLSSPICCHRRFGHWYMVSIARIQDERKKTSNTSRVSSHWHYQTSSFHFQFYCFKHSLMG